MFETFEENGVYYVKGSVFVIAILDRDTLELKDYVDTAFTTREQADDLMSRKAEDFYDAAYIVQEKEMMIPIYRTQK
jgi:hypothetical protein